MTSPEKERTDHLKLDPFGPVDWYLGLLDLAENVFTVFYFSSNYTFATVFVAFMVIDFIKSLNESFGTLCYKKFFIFTGIGLEILQVFVFLYFCDFAFVPKIFYGIIGGLQCLPDVYDIFQSEEKEEENDLTEDEKAAAKGTLFGFACSKFTIGLTLSAGTLFYVFTSLDSPFQDQWFQVYLTVIVWLQNLFILIVFTEYYPNIKLINEKIQRYNNFCALALLLAAFSIAVPYYQQGVHTKYDEVICIFAFIGFAAVPTYVYSIYTGKNLADLNKEEDELDIPV